VDLLGPCGAFTEPCRPLTFSWSPAGTPESDPFRPMCCPCVSAFALQPTEAHVGVDLLVRGPCFTPGVETRAGKSPRTPFVVSRTCEPRPTGDVLRKSGLTYPAHPHRFAFCPSAPLRQAVLRTSSWLAPSLDHRPTLRSTGEEDARCAQPTSATQTTCVHPHLARSRFALTGCPAGSPHGVLGSVRSLSHRGARRFTTPEPASADRHRVHVSALLPHGLESEAWAFCSHGTRAIEPLTPLSRTPFTVRLPGLPRSCVPDRASPFWRGWRGSDSAWAAEITFIAVS